MCKIPYTKQPISIDAQIEKLSQRGLIFNDIEFAKEKLQTVSYYRFRAYTAPFQDNSSPDTPFTTAVSFEDVFSLYTFDHELRGLLLSMLDVIEIAFRTQIIYKLSLKHGSHWHTKHKLFCDIDAHKKNLKKLDEEIERSKEDFIVHYFHKYSYPVTPPSWMSLEVSSMGLLSRLYGSLINCPEKVEVARFFGFNTISQLSSVMHSFTIVRNTCAHCSKIWNRNFHSYPQTIKHSMYTPHLPLIAVNTRKIYYLICLMVYILRNIRPNIDYVTKVKNTIATCPLNQLKEMGFPKNWELDRFWQ